MAALYSQRPPTDASVTRFSFANLNTTSRGLDHSLALNFTIVNPNRKAAIFYRQIQVAANYGNQMFSLATLPFEPLGCCCMNRTVSQYLSLNGSKFLVFGEQELSWFDAESVAGIYSIDLKLYVDMVLFGQLKTKYSNPLYKLDCKLKVPLQFSEASANGFNFKTTKCRSDVSLQALKQWAMSVESNLYHKTFKVMLVWIYILAAVLY